MNGFPAILIADGSSQVEQLAQTFGVSWPHLISQTISFAIVCYFLQRFAYKPVLKMLEERRDNIAEGLQAADKSREELAQSEQQRQRILDEAHRQAEKILADVKLAVADVRQQKIKEASDDAEQIRTKAHEQIERDRQQMRRDLENEVGRLVVQTTASVTGHVMTPGDQQRLLAETAQSLKN